MTARDLVDENQCFERMTSAADTSRDNAHRIASLEKWRWLQTGAIAAIVSLASFLGTVAAFFEVVRQVKP